MNKEKTPLEALESIKRTIQQLDYGFISKEDCEDFKIIGQALKDYEQLNYAVNDLANNHIELVKTKGGFYFKIKNSKGKEKSWTSLIDFWKRWFEIKENKDE